MRCFRALSNCSISNSALSSSSTVVPSVAVDSRHLDISLTLTFAAACHRVRRRALDNARTVGVMRMTIALLGLFALASCGSGGAGPTPEPETISSSDAALAVTWGQMPAADEAIICEAWNEYLVPRSELLDAFFAGLDEPSTFGRAQVDQFIEAQCDP